MSNRILKINSEIAKAVSEILTYEIKSPHITGIITVTKVDTTPDLEISKIYLSIFTQDDKNEVFNQIKHSAGFFRKRICEKVVLRKVPYLQFYLDDSLDYSNNINEKINEIEKSRKESNSDANK